MKKNILKGLFFGVLLMSCVTVQSQEKPVIFSRTVDFVTPEGFIRCASSEYNRYIIENFPEALVSNDKQNVVFRNIESNQDTNNILTIPVVVHIIHSGQIVGVEENIADAQVLSQIQVLNQDFRRTIDTPGHNTHISGADTEIEFCLARIDPSGNPTNGINRVNLGITSWNTENQIRNNIQAILQWDPYKYYNIYVVNFGGGLSQVLGYATYPFGTGLQGLYPGSGTNVEDGFVIGYKYFGSRSIYPQGTYEWGYDEGRTSTHEMGHALGLIHIWGDPTTSYNCTVDDYCADTPMQLQPNGACPTNAFSCGSADMYRNYMDYTQDSCMNIFTQNQKTRMRQAVQYGIRRSSLITSNVCQSTANTEDFDLVMISLYPNPASNILNLIVPDNYQISGNIKIYNTVGQVVFSVNSDNVNMYSIDVSGFQSGVYFVKINKGKQSRTLQFVKQ